MKIDVEKVIRELRLVPFGAKGWLRNDNIACPNCGKSDKFGVKITNNSGGVHCFKCDYSANFLKFLKSINRQDLASFEVEYSQSVKLEFLKELDEEEIVLPEIELPRGFERIYDSDYLNERGFQPYQYHKYGVGLTNHFLERKLHEYIIFQIRQHNKLVGYLARSIRSKEWHKQNLKDHKEGKSKLVLRYRNSTGTDFSHILGNYDDITYNTHTVILVEGLFDCSNVESLLRLNESDEIKCCFSFGNNLSDQQIKLLLNTNVERIILMYDPGTINQMKTKGLQLSKYFEVMVAEIKDPNIDPGEIGEKYLSEILKNMKNILYFYNNRISLQLL